ncbi:hypothetical protein AGMMS50225_22900 [Betaproteobacteria bacterium]|nr:hypothetical protein AGMMS50225_22900 [Betaproteobacteria bacterium]
MQRLVPPDAYRVDGPPRHLDAVLALLTRPQLAVGADDSVDDAGREALTQDALDLLQRRIELRLRRGVFVGGLMGVAGAAIFDELSRQSRNVRYLGKIEMSAFCRGEGKRWRA